MFEYNYQCSKNFKLKDIIHCGETWNKYKNIIDNLPKEPETIKAISFLCENILEPVQKEFGKIILTYGFASYDLTKKIKNRIYPKLDQHSGYEKNKKGNYVCERLGQAVDFYIPNINSKNICKWINLNCQFDRMYFYGEDRPIHISIGPENKKQIILMKKYNSKNYIPKVVKKI